MYEVAVLPVFAEKSFITRSTCKGIALKGVLAKKLHVWVSFGMVLVNKVFQ